MKFLSNFCMLALLSQASLAQGMAIGPGRHPALVRDGQGHLLVAYENRGDICLRRSDDAGQSWSEERTVCSTPGPSAHPSLGVESTGAVDLVWEEGKEVWFSRAADDRATFSAPSNLSGAKVSASEPDLAVGPDDSLHVVWTDERENPQAPDIYYLYTYNGGQSWTRPANVSRTPGVCSHPVVGMGGDKVVHIAWLDTSSGQHRPDVFAVRGSQDSYSRPINVSNTAGRSGSPQMTVTPRGRVYGTWMDDSLNHNVWDVYFARADNGELFKPPQFFDTPGDSMDPCLASDEPDKVVVAWSDSSEDPKAPDIFVAQSGDGGATFSAPKNISHTAGVSRFPTVVLVEGQIVVVWEELEKDSYWLKISRESLTRKGRPSSSGGKY